MKLPLFNTDIQAFSLLQTKWKSILDPLISNRASQSLILKNIKLGVGRNTINHGLGRTLQGWFVIRQNSSATFYDNQEVNSTPETTLILVASAPCLVSLEVF